MTQEDSSAQARRFASMERLLGAGALQHLGQAHVVVVGIGGVGSWAAEALARSGVGRLTLMDLDHIALSNINRQVHALDSTLGQAKVEAMRERIAQINPECNVAVLDEFLDESNLPAVLGLKAHVLIDAIDQARVKVALIAAARAAGQALVVCGAAGGKQDPSQIQAADLSAVHNDPLLAKVRQQLRREHGFSKVEPGSKPALMKVQCVYSREPMRHDTPVVDGAAGLACAGYGSSVTVTGTLGFVAAAQAMQMMTTGNK
jgi:tRNA threonylcarbamoyladenosine dehydratase